MLSGVPEVSINYRVARNKRMFGFLFRLVVQWQLEN